MVSWTRMVVGKIEGIQPWLVKPMLLGISGGFKNVTQMFFEGSPTFLGGDLPGFFSCSAIFKGPSLECCDAPQVVGPLAKG